MPRCQNGRADIQPRCNLHRLGWVYEITNGPLKPQINLKQDIDFTGLADQPFGVAIWNKSNYQHGITA